MADRVSQIVLETEGKAATPHARVSQEVLETAGQHVGTKARSSQLVIETLGYRVARNARVTQIFLESLITNFFYMPPVYPTLPGIDIKVIWRPKAYNMQPQIHTSGREFIVGASQYPLHEFELVYNLLRNRPTEIEFKTFMGFYLAVGGTLSGFLFKNPYDNSVQAQSFITTDGVNSQFGPMVRTYGASGNTGTEPVGYIDTTQPFNLYVDGALVSPTDATWGYTIVQATPVSIQLKFNNTPGAGHVITYDASYFYYVRFQDDMIEFEQVLNNVFQAKKIVLVSKRG